MINSLHLRCCLTSKWQTAFGLRFHPLFRMSEVPIIIVCVILGWMILDYADAGMGWKKFEGMYRVNAGGYSNCSSNGQFRFTLTLCRGPMPCFVLLSEAGVHVESRFPCGWFRAPLFIPWKDCQIEAGKPGLFGKFPHLKIVTSKNDLIIYMRGDWMDRAKRLKPPGANL